ncbi:MAG: hypothetical protein M0033_04495 [Nitrospiraceae bacterium]|nr:hypothetical protein [Nitrospiraceae bacterium]
MINFWAAFLPNLVATILGVVLGLPVALYVNRRLTERQRALDRAERTKRRDDSASVLIAACEYNMKVLDRVKELALEGKALRNPDLRSTTWDIVNHMFSPLCPDPVLLQKLSHHWLRLQRLEQLNEEMFAQAVGTRPPLSDQEIVLGMWSELHCLASSLYAHAAELIDDLDKLKTTEISASSTLNHESVSTEVLARPSRL